jgi:AraC-like DNA-binding protein
MEPTLIPVLTGGNHSFRAKTDDKPYQVNRWHYHYEMEIVHIVKGQGVLYFQDVMTHFKDGSIIVIGSGIAHLWKFNSAYTKKMGKHAQVQSLQFRPDFWGSTFLDLPENIHLRKLIIESSRGISLSGKGATLAKKQLRELQVAGSSKKITQLLTLLETIALCPERKFLTKASKIAHDSFTQNERITAVIQYSLEHFLEPIRIKEVASLACLSENAFCRFFKQHTRKTYSQFVQELRMQHAEHLLQQSEKSMKTIAKESGFPSVPYFNRLFLKIKSQTPLQYRNNFVQLAAVSKI